MSMKKVVSQVVVALIALIAIIYGRKVTFPDNIHTSHGFPMTWGVHQLVTIAGPVDTWRVNLVNLSIDFVLWVGIVILIPILVERLVKN